MSPSGTIGYGQGPWGRAIGQWLLAQLDAAHVSRLAGRPGPGNRPPGPPAPVTRQHLAYPATTEARHVLLQESEFENWPDNAPRLIKVATFQDHHGETRVLARTEGDLVTPAGRVFSRDEEQ